MAYSTTAATLIDRTRRFVRDYPDYDTITAALTDTTGTTVTVADTTLYAKRWPIEVDYETMQIRSITNATTMVVERGAFGSTAATHLNGTKILMRPAFYAAEILDALNQSLQATWPFFYVPVLDTSITTTDSTYEYTVPNMPGTFNGNTIQIPRVYKVEAQYSGDLTYRELSRNWIARGATSKIKFRAPEPAGATLRVSGYGPFPDFTTTAGVLDALFPPQGEYLLPMLATSFLLMSGEAGRARYDTGATDRREEANRQGGSMTAALQILARAREELLKVAMPPMPRHAKRVL